MNLLDLLPPHAPFHIDGVKCSGPLVNDGAL